MELAYGDSWTYDYETFVEWDLAHKPVTRSIAIPQTSGKQSTIKHLPPVILDYPSSEIGKHKDITVPLR